MDKAFTEFKFSAENIACVTHAVPAERVLPYLPEDLLLDTVVGPEGEKVALVTVTCSLNRDATWIPSGESSGDFHQVMYRTYVRNGDEKAVFVFGSYIEKGTPLVIERLGMENTFASEFDVSVAFDSDTGGYPRYYLEVLSDGGDTIIQLTSDGGEPEESMPFKSGTELADFITGRSAAYYPIAEGQVGKLLMDQNALTPDPSPTSRARGAMVQGTLLAGQFDLWEELEILRPMELEQTYSVLIQPAVTITLRRT